jgi:hypothetical protein
MRLSLARERQREGRDMPADPFAPHYEIPGRSPATPWARRCSAVAASVFGIFVIPLLYITAERLRGRSGKTKAE